MSPVNTKTTINFPQKTSANSSDVVVFVYAYGNTEAAQTALITIQNLLSNTANLAANVVTLQLQDQRADPPSSTSLTVPQGTIFFSNSFGYYATQNNYLVRWSVNLF